MFSSGFGLLVGFELGKGLTGVEGSGFLRRDLPDLVCMGVSGGDEGGIVEDNWELGEVEEEEVELLEGDEEEVGVAVVGV